MYIENTTNEVRNFFENLEEFNDESRIKILLYILNAINNKQINDKNIVNPDLMEDDDANVFDVESIGIDLNYCFKFLQLNVGFYNLMNENNNAYEDNGNLMGIEYNEPEKKMISKFEKHSFNEKLDIISEIIIRYDNKTYFIEEYQPLSLLNDESGFDIASKIQKYKESLK